MQPRTCDWDTCGSRRLAEHESVAFCVPTNGQCMQNEVKLLLELLPKYYAHVERYPHTLLIKFYGLYRVVPNNGSKVSSTNALVLFDANRQTKQVL